MFYVLEGPVSQYQNILHYWWNQMGSFKAKVCFDSLILSCASYQHNVKAILVLQILNVCLAGKQRSGVRNIFAITWFLFLLRQMGHSTTFRFLFSFFFHNRLDCLKKVANGFLLLLLIITKRSYIRHLACKLQIMYS